MGRTSLIRKPPLSTAAHGNSGSMPISLSSPEIEPLIVVGATTPRSVWRNTLTPGTEGWAAQRRGAIRRSCSEELKPQIDGLYRTLPDEANTAMGGSSLGGLVTLYLEAGACETFGKLAVIAIDLVEPQEHPRLRE